MTTWYSRNPAGAGFWKSGDPLSMGGVSLAQRALYWNGLCVAQITDALIGTGKKPIVLMLDGTLRERVASEGTPLILVNSKRMLLNTSTETLLV